MQSIGFQSLTYCWLWLLIFPPFKCNLSLSFDIFFITLLYDQATQDGCSLVLYILCSTSPCFTNMHPHDYLILLIIKLNRSRACLRLPPAPLMVSPITDEPTWCPFPLPSSTPRSKNCCHPCLLSAICSVVSLQDSASSCKIFSLINCWWLLLSQGSCFSLTVGQLHSRQGTAQHPSAASSSPLPPAMSSLLHICIRRSVSLRS